MRHAKGRVQAVAYLLNYAISSDLVALNADKHGPFVAVVGVFGLNDFMSVAKSEPDVDFG